MEAPTSLFSGTNLKMDTTTCLSPPCYPIVKINSSSASICNIFSHYHLSTSHFYSFTILLLFSLSHSSPWSSSTSTLSPNQQCTSLAHVHTPMLLMCCTGLYFHVMAQIPETELGSGDRNPVLSCHSGPNLAKYWWPVTKHQQAMLRPESYQHIVLGTYH